MARSFSGAFVAIALQLAFAALPGRAEAQAPETFVIGTHGGDSDQGLFSADLDAASGRLSSLRPAAGIVRPTWQVAAPDGAVVYSVSETGNDGRSQASVYSLGFDRNSGKLTILNQVGSGGGGATYLALDPRSKTLFVANYGTGTVAALPVLADGRLGPAASVQKDIGSGPSPRQKSAHAHSVAIDPSGRFLLVADLGADRIFIYRFDPATRQLTPAATPYVATPPGSGPRHMAFGHDGRFLFVDSELSGEVSAYRWNGAAGTLRLVQTLSAFPSDYQGNKSAAELAVSKDGRFLYVSTRNNDMLVVYAISRSNGHLREIQRLPAGGKTPWSFALSPDGAWLVVANEASNRVDLFGVDRNSGRLTATGQSLSVPTPVSIAFIPQ